MQMIFHAIISLILTISLWVCSICITEGFHRSHILIHHFYFSVMLFPSLTTLPYFIDIFFTGRCRGKASGKFEA